MKMKMFVAAAALLASAMAWGGNAIGGRVTCDGRGIAGVMVTDGYECVTTGNDGRYNMELDGDARFVYVTVPSGYLPRVEKTVPLFYYPVEAARTQYDFELRRNPVDDTRHVAMVQADVQLTSQDDLATYKGLLKDVVDYADSYKGRDVFGIDLGDIVGDTPSLFEPYIDVAAAMKMPVWRAIGNHDMTYGGRTYEYSYSTFESYFGPIYYSFNKGKAHYIVLNNNFYVNRDYQYIGYIDERTFRWIEKDLALVPSDNLIFVIMHIPGCLTKELKWNTLIQDETSNIAGLWQLLEGRNAHLLTGHTHFNWNVCFNESLMEHNTAAVCGIWWKAPVCMDGTPQGYGVYEVNGTDVKWHYKSMGYDADYQFRAYPVGASTEYPGDIIANVWNWDELWKVEWIENGKVMGEMTRFEGYDPMASEICADKERVQYEWISPIKTPHMFRATPHDAAAKIEVRVTDRFGNVYVQKIGK
ncbi:MAG TPA: calcineurin-like phosphoesterase C-terminal domain-containing protein [Candidatus Avimuribaculum pullicola]|mgnify:CR=1 FL=1|nr:calcineurin-like phosphoesterase C-terminal domain-containing protein [Candidatus Avimuribaculum pullicola]